ncbi:MAG: F0F1 ATP synthase subunit gamma [Thermodesulfobacteriota bacterium]
MPNLHQLEKKIDTATGLQSIVKTMKSMAAVNIHQYEQAASSLDSYLETIETGLSAVIGETEFLWKQGRPQGRERLLVVFGSDQGLCGRFNKKLVEFLQYEKKEILPRNEISLLVTGARIKNRLESEGYNIIQGFWSPGSVEGINRHILKIVLEISSWRERQAENRIDLLFNYHNQSGSTAEPLHLPLFPLGPRKLRELTERPWPSRCLPWFAEKADNLASYLIRQFLFVAIFRAQAQSLASEQASRLQSLQQAEKNIREHLEELQSDYRQLRQSVITGELLDLVSGFKSAAGKSHT